MAVALTGLAGVGYAIMATLSLAAGHGGFSGQIAGLLFGYGVLHVVAAVFLWRCHALARGPVVALALLNGFIAVEALAGQPLAWLWVAGCLATVVAAVLPATTAALRVGRVAG